MRKATALKGLIYRGEIIRAGEEFNVGNEDIYSMETRDLIKVAKEDAGLPPLETPKKGRK